MEHQTGGSKWNIRQEVPSGTSDRRFQVEHQTGGSKWNIRQEVTKWNIRQEVTKWNQLSLYTNGRACGV